VAKIMYSTKDPDTIAFAEWLKRLSDLQDSPPNIGVDEPGYGGSVIDWLRKHNVPCTGYNPSKRPLDPSRFFNARAEDAWRLREEFRLERISIPADDHELANQLAALTFTLDSASRVVLQSKERMKKSPDRADSLVIALRTRGVNDYGALVENLLRDARKQELANARRPSTEVEFGRGHRTTEERWGGQRGSWKSRLDPDLPTWPGVR
jgi:hypothetical protein